VTKSLTSGCRVNTAGFTPPPPPSYYNFFFCAFSSGNGGGSVVVYQSSHYWFDIVLWNIPSVRKEFFVFVNEKKRKVIELSLQEITIRSKVSYKIIFSNKFDLFWTRTLFFSFDL
jgi:hypothetical protein